MVFKKSDHLPDLSQWKSVIDKINKQGCQQLKTALDKFPDIKNLSSPQNINIICYQQSCFPEKLKSFPVLFTRGKSIKNTDKIAAVIGTRNCTAQGRLTANKISSILTDFKFRIVSDLSEGIARISQQNACQQGGSNIVVFPGSAGEYFPGSSFSLANLIADTGTLIWLWPPFKLKSKLYKSNFQSANAVIASLADVIILVEASMKSGTYSVIKEGADLGKDILVWSKPRKGHQGDLPAELLNQGCTGFYDYVELMDLLGLPIQDKKNGKENSFSKFTPEQQQVLKLLDEPMPISILLEKTNMNINELLNLLIELEMNGHIQRIEGGMIQRN
ncbi:MAG: DNA-processing protein DprA [bacterium]